jgi:hypothetical protein
VTHPVGRPGGILEGDQVETGRAATPRFSVGDEDQDELLSFPGGQSAQLGGGHWAPTCVVSPWGVAVLFTSANPLTVRTDTPRICGFRRGVAVDDGGGCPSHCLSRNCGLKPLRGEKDRARVSTEGCVPVTDRPPGYLLQVSGCTC